MTDLLSDSSYKILGKEYPLPLDSEGRNTKNAILLYATLLFAQQGYEGVSMRDLGNCVGLQVGSLYSHFPSKGALWKEVIQHTERLYLLYFEQLDAVLQQADSFEAMLEIMLREPIEMKNQFTCFAFSLILSEQLYREDDWDIMRKTFLDYSFNFMQGWFDRCVERGYVAPFDTRMTAVILMHAVLIAIQMHAQSLLGRAVPHDPKQMLVDLRAFILNVVQKK